MHRNSQNTSPRSASMKTTGTSQSMLNVNTAGSKRPRTITAQGEVYLQQHSHTPPPKDQVVVGITAASGDDVEDWSEDFVELTPRHSSTRGSATASARSSGRFSDTGGDGDATLTRSMRSFPRSTSSFHRSSLARRSWHRQHSFDAGHGDSGRGIRIRRSSNDGNEQRRMQPSLGVTTASPRVDSLRESAPLHGRESATIDDEDEEDGSSTGFGRDRTDSPEEDGDHEAAEERQATNTKSAPPGEDDFDEDEDWDVEFGFTERSDDGQDDSKPGSGTFVDADRRRSDNFNIFIRGFHDMMAGEDLMDEDDESSRGKKTRGSHEEPLFQRTRSDVNAATSIDGTVDAVLRTSLSSLPGSTEYSLVDKYRLLDVACSSSYAVRIERYPKPCVSFSNLERDAATATEFPMFTDNRLEQWLMNVVRSKCKVVNDLMTHEQGNTPNPRQQKNHQFRTLVSIPFGKRFVDKCFKQISVYHFLGEEKSNRELVRVFFEKLATAGIADEHWSSKLSRADLAYIAGTVMEVLQEAARLYGPVPSSGIISPPPGANMPGSSNSAVSFWMRQFQTILTICVEAFPTYRHMIALVELRFVCHHLVGLANTELSYSWQVCNQYPAFQATTPEPLAGQSAPIIANEILQHYGALLTVLQVEVDKTGTSQTQDAPESPASAESRNQGSRFCVSTNPHALLVLALCDIQTVFTSRSALAETMIPELGDLFEFDDEDIMQSFREYNLAVSPMASDETQPELPEESFPLELLKPSSYGRMRVLQSQLYREISVLKEPLVKAKCCAVLSSMHSEVAATVLTGGTPQSHLKLAESFAYEALRILEWVTARNLAELSIEVEEGDATKKEPWSSVFANDGLLSCLGRDVLESLGNLLVSNQKYRYGILCLEAATEVFSLLNQGKDHERVDRLMCTLTTQADDVKRALPLHEKVAMSCLRQGNTNEYVFLTQTLTSMWLREGNFTRAEEFLTSAFGFLRNQTSLLPPFYLSSLSGSLSGSEGLSSSSRSGTILTASSSASSSGAGSFIFTGGRGNTSEVDLWLNHDISLHLLLRDIYRASGRFIEAMRVLEYLLNYSSRLPRGKRTHLRMLLAEDSLEQRVLDTTRYMFHLLDQEANYFCDRLLQTTLGGILGGAGGGSNNSGGFGSSNGGGGSSSGGRSMGGMGSESRFCFDMVLSVRYIIGRAKLYLELGELRYAYAWLSLAHIKNERESVRTYAKLHVLDGRVFMEMLRRQHEHRLCPEKAVVSSSVQQSGVTTVEEMLQAFESSLYALNKTERQHLRDRLSDFCGAVESSEKCMELGVQAFWTAYDHYQSLDDTHHQLKSLLGVVQVQLVPIERSFFALGSRDNDEYLRELLGSCASLPRRSSMKQPAAKETETPNGDEKSGTQDDEEESDEADDGDNAVDKVRKTLQECQRLLRQALSMSEQTAEPSTYFRTLVFCSQTWTWLERLAPYKSERPIKEAAAFWEEAVKVMKAVFFRRVAFEYDPANRRCIQQIARSGGLHGPTALGGDRSTFSLVPILNFRERFILRLEALTLQLLTTACQLQQFDRVPEYVEDMLVLHMDELLSARMCLNSIAHQLRSFRSQQLHQSLVRHIPLHSIPGPTRSQPSTSVKPNSAEASVPQPKTFSSNSLPGVMPSSSIVNASGTKRKGHKKNQSMSSISELLASSSTGGQLGSASSSFHDLSLSFVSASGRGTVLSGGATPRTGLASFSDRPASYSKQTATAVDSALQVMSVTVKSHISGDEDQAGDTLRIRSRSAPQSNSPVASKSSGHEASQPVVERQSGGKYGAGAAPVRVVDLKDVHLWSSSSSFEADDFANTNGTSNSAIGIYDFDDVQSERLWWIFNGWRASKESYVTGKAEVSAFRHRNLKTLRTLMDAFDPQQVAVVYTSDKQSFRGMLGFDVAHINSHTLIEDRGFVLCIGYDSMMQRSVVLPSSSSRRHHQHHLHRLDFKVFKAVPDRTSSWRHEIPRADWYLSQHHAFDGTGSGDAVVRLLKLLGAKIVLKLIGALLLENSLVVVGSSFPLIKEVTLCLVKMLRPFRWQHTFLPFLPIPSWRFLSDALHHHVQTQLAGRPKAKMSLGLSTSDWRWGSPRASSTGPSSTRSASSSNSRTPTSSSDRTTEAGEVEPPFIIGTMADTWQSCLQRLKSSTTDERMIPMFVNVLDLDNVASFALAKSSLNAVSFPRKLRKQFMERFDKVVKHRRRVQEKSMASLRHHQSSAYNNGGMTPSSNSQHSFQDATSRTPASSSQRRGTDGHTSKHSAYSRTSPVASPIDDDRLVYDTECATAYITGLHEFYDRLAMLSAERFKKMQGKKKHSKRQEIKSWFSSTHEFDAYVDKFLDTAIYEQYRTRGAVVEASAVSVSHASSGVLSRSNSGVIAVPPSATLASTTSGGINSSSNAYHSAFTSTSLTRSFGSMSSTSSSFNGPSSTAHHQLAR